MKQVKNLYEIFFILVNDFKFFFIFWPNRRLAEKNYIGLDGSATADSRFGQWPKRYLSESSGTRKRLRLRLAAHRISLEYSTPEI